MTQRTEAALSARAQQTSTDPMDLETLEAAGQDLLEAWQMGRQMAQRNQTSATSRMYPGRASRCMLPG